MVTINVGTLHNVLDHVYGVFMHKTKISPLFFSRRWGGSKLEIARENIQATFPRNGWLELTWRGYRRRRIASC